MQGQRISKAWYVVVALVSLALHFPFFDLPPSSQHVWRQTMTLTVADNFLYEDLNILHPRVNQRYDGNGITGMHFPLYEWILAGLYQIFGNHFWLHRAWSWLLSILGAMALARITNQWFNQKMVGFTAFALFLFSPEVFYDGFIALPDIMALAFCLWGLERFFAYWESQSQRTLLLSAILFMLGGAVKLQYLGIGFLVLGVVIRDRSKLNLKQILNLSYFAAIAVIPVLAWYRYAKHMIQKSGLADVGLELKPAESLEQALYVLKKNFISDLPELMLGYVAFAGLLLVVFRMIRHKTIKHHPLTWPILMFVLGYSVYHLIELKVLEHHQYYMLPYLTVLTPFAALGVVYLSKGRMVLFTLLLTAQVVLCGLRMIPARFTHPNKHVPEAFMQQESRMKLVESLPKGALVMAGPDLSRTIYFYFLQTKGWGYGEESDLFFRLNNGKTNLQDAIDRGCQFLILNENMKPSDELKPYLAKQHIQVEDIRIYDVSGFANQK